MPSSHLRVLIPCRRAMKPTPAQLWSRFQCRYREFPDCGLAIDLSRLDFDDDYLTRMAEPMGRALQEMRDLEAGGIANPDEDRMVGHYWLRKPASAPLVEREKIAAAVESVKEFAATVHEGRVRGERGVFTNLLVVGIGGSALGPQFVASALGRSPGDRMTIRFLDNTDPEGIDRTLAPIIDQLGQTLVVVISKSGRTPETRNGMLEVAEAYRRKGLKFARHAVAITQFDESRSELYARARSEGWLATFPMWDWVGGRTSVTSAVGLLPAALQGLDIDGLLRGAAACDEVTRTSNPLANPAALLALAWFHAGSGRGAKDMVVLPYKDRLELFAKYLQQLVMESLGKELDRAGRVVNQGLAVYGNKGSTDQHAYVQQLRDGPNNFFVVFLQVLRGRPGDSIEVEPGVTTADYLNGLLLGTRAALHEKRRESVTLTVPDVTAFSVGSLIALFERAVGFYASLIDINAYHQPGVEAGKKAATDVLALQTRILRKLAESPGRAYSVEELTAAVGSDDPETVFKLGQHLAANARGVHQLGAGVTSTFSARAAGPGRPGSS